MEEFLNKYDINICFETIYNWKGKILDIEDLNEIVYNKETIKLKFNLIGKIYSKECIYTEKKGYFTEKDIINLIFSYYNGNLNPNELTDVKNKYEITDELETRKDLLYLIKTLHFKEVLLKDDIYVIELE